MKIQEIKIEDEDYPIRLKMIKNPPQKLYVIGNKKILNQEGIAMIGSRNCSQEGVRNARLFAVNIAKAGFTIISGMARGIDASAHLGAIEIEGKTIAVLGNGPKYIYPPENKEIYNKILETGGAIVSEYPDDTPPDAEKFRKRNRIISGLSIGILIVEARNRSGTGITARYAKEQGKNIFCIPSSIENKKAIGSNLFIKKGAIMVLEPSDVLEKYGIKEVRQITMEDLEKLSKSSLLKLNEIKEEYRSIYEVLYEPLNVNEIGLKTNIGITELYEKLFMMEMDGLIEKYENKYVIKSKE